MSIFILSCGNAGTGAGAGKKNRGAGPDLVHGFNSSYQLVFGNIDDDDAFEVASVVQTDTDGDNTADDVTINLYEDFTNLIVKKAPKTWDIANVGTLRTGGYLGTEGTKGKIVITTEDVTAQIRTTTITVDLADTTATPSIRHEVDQLSFSVDLDQTGTTELLTVATTALPASDLANNFYAVASFKNGGVAILVQYNTTRDTIRLYETPGYNRLENNFFAEIKLGSKIAAGEVIYGIGLSHYTAQGYDPSKKENILIYGGKQVYVFPYEEIMAQPLSPGGDITDGSYQLVFGNIDTDDAFEVASVVQTDVDNDGADDDVTIRLYEILADLQNQETPTATWTIANVGTLRTGGYLGTEGTKGKIVITTEDVTAQIRTTTITVDLADTTATPSIRHEVDQLSFSVDLDQTGTTELLTVATTALPASDLANNFYAVAGLTNDRAATLFGYDRNTLTLYEKKGNAPYSPIPDFAKPANLQGLIGSEEEIYGIGLSYYNEKGVYDPTLPENLFIYGKGQVYVRPLLDIIGPLPLPAAQAVTPADPILIDNVQGLRNIDYDDTSRGYKYQLTTDIDLSLYLPWEPIGAEANPFVGSFDGNGKTISGLHIDKPSTDYIGLFSQIGTTSSIAEIRDLSIVVHTEGIAGRGDVGALAGSSYATIRNVQVSGGKVRGADYIGGLVGRQEGSSITNSSSRVAVKGTNSASYVGGLVGTLGNSSIRNSYATGVVELDQSGRAGGLVGTLDNSNIRNSYATGAVTGTSVVGGLVGFQPDGSITHSYYDGTTTKKTQGRNNTADATGEVSAFYTRTGRVRTTDADNGALITEADFTGWTFDPTNWHWVGDGQWPILKWQWDLQNSAP